MLKGITPRLAEAGKIKIGGLGPERKSGKGNTFRPPLKFDHFLITGTERDAAGDLAIDADMMKALANDGGADADGKIRSIPIVLHSDNVDEVFPTSYALYTTRRCACRGNGETATKREVKDGKYTGQSKEVKCPCPYLHADSGPVCKPNGKLFASIAAPGSAIAGAVHIWRTTSIISVQQMIGSLLQIKAVCGTLRNVPLWLRVKPISVEPAGQGAITVFVCHVELRAADIEAVQRKALEAAKIRRELGSDDSEYRRMISLPAHDAEPLDEQEEIAAEFYPEDATNAAGVASAADVAGGIAAAMGGTVVPGGLPLADGARPGDRI